MRKPTLFLAILLLAWPAALTAQHAPGLSPGDRIRIASKERGGVFTLRAVDKDSLLLENANGQFLRQDIASLRRLEIDRGRRTRTEGAIRGAVWGGLAFGTLGAAAGLLDEGGTWGAEDRAAAGAIVFGGLGTVLGIASGALAPPHRWERVPLPLRLDLSGHGGGGAALAVRLRL